MRTRERGGRGESVCEEKEGFLKDINGKMGGRERRRDRETREREK